MYNKYTREANMAYNWNYNQDILIYYSKDEQFLEYASTRLSISPCLGYTYSYESFSVEASIGGTISDITVFVTSISRNEWISTSTNDGLQYDPNGQFYNLIEHISMSKSNERIFTPYFQLKYNYQFNRNLSLSIAASAS
ncbi:MAG: hypothetical protein JXR36_09545, partial [Bacteroidales bacterium]|nr:hypothetical protein [Bacteroidales bacterium]